MFKKFFYILFLIVICIPLVTFQTKNSQAETVDELQTKIDAVEKNRQKLEKEIAAYQTQLKNISQEASTLQSSIKSLDVSTSKITSEVKLTETNINKTSYTIKDTNLEILDKEKRITRDKMAIRDALRKLDEASTRSVWEILLSNQDLADFWTEMDSIIQVQAKISEQVESIQNIKANLEKAKAELEKQKAELEDYNKELSDRKKVLDSTKKEKSTLLSVTKSKESEYQRLLKEKEAQKKAFDEEIQRIEESIKFLIDPKSFPSAKKGILSWPLDIIRITQSFGGTQFAKNNPGIYGRPYHPGVDFGIPTGSKVKSISSGVVKGFDNTDAYKGCYAWGKWILVEHDNGLSSLYAHLSVISVVSGQKVTAGQVIGYSGNTGVSTGPHLHLSLYATQGVKISKYGQYRPGGTGCSATNATGPFADQDAYLNPIDYLPNL
jgi:murein DD-endopeptidase MepM/ murein hydrolase activator NlpD